MTPRRLDEILAKIPSLKIALVGDVFLDKYFDIDAQLAEVSLETGRPAHQVVDIRCYGGAGGSAAQKLAALGVCWVPAISVIGTDGEGHDLKTALQRDGIDPSLLVASPQRRTGTYAKPMLREPDRPPRELERLDIQNRAPLPAELEDQLMAILQRHLDGLDGAAVIDQAPQRNCGVITDRMRQFLSRLAEKHPDKVFLADSRCRIGEFRHMLTKPNRSELAEAAGLSEAAAGSHEQVRSAGRKLFRMTGRPVIVTLGPDGVLLLEQEAETRVPGFGVSGPVDIVGAGDSVTAGVLAALCAGATPAEAALVGTLAASITIQQIGVTGTATPQQVRDRLIEYNRQRQAAH